MTVVAVADLVDAVWDYSRQVVALHGFFALDQHPR